MTLYEGEPVTSRNESNITLRIICLDPPDLPDDSCTGFGLQNKAQELTMGQKPPDGSPEFTFTIKVKGTDTQAPEFAGPYVHGSAQQRFLYLSLGAQEGNAWQWIRRIKVPLSGITWQNIKDATSKNGILEATVDGTRSATVPLFGEGWVIKQS